MRRPVRDVLADLRAAGFSADQAVTMAAIGGAVSGFDPAAAVGDAVGLYGVRADPGQTGRGGPRDVTVLAADPASQAQAAFLLSDGGRDFSAWPAYTSGGYQAFLPVVQAAAADPFPTWGPDWAPWNWPSVAGNAVAARTRQTLGGVRTVVIQVAVVGLGVALLAAGAIATVRPHQIERAARRKLVSAVTG